MGGSAGVGPSGGGVSSGGTSGGISPSAGGPLDVAGASGDSGIEPSSGGEGGAPGDGCPDDPDKLAPGECGCGVPDVASAAGTDCLILKSLLAHRYDFEGTGTAVQDRVGVAHGVIARGSTLSKLDGKGVVLLGGGAVGAYVDLPNGLLSSLTNATFEAWVTWGGGSSWQRIFDFGDSTAAVPENNQAAGSTYLFLTPSSSTGVMSIGYSLGGWEQQFDVVGAEPLPQTLSQVVAVADDAADVLALYVDGIEVGRGTWSDELAQVNDLNVWLGRSQYKDDSELNAVFHEFRIYAAALSPAQVTSAFQAGPDPAFLAY